MTHSVLKSLDSYKVSQWKQYPPGTEYVYSYLESRGGIFDETTFFGLQYILKKYFCGKLFNQQDLDDAREYYKKHFGRDDVFNYAGWQYILDKYNGHLPIRIKAVPEGATLATHNVLMTVENTDPQCYWLTNWLETQLLHVWYTITVCSLSRHIKQDIHKYLVETGTPESISFRLHDFGFRGVAGYEAAGMGGAAHLVNFMGTDTLAGIDMLREFYGSDMPGFSIPASEHSTISSWGRENENEAQLNMLTQYPEGLVASVSDTWDVYQCCSDIWGDKLKGMILARNGTVVVRPDSGIPVEVVLNCLRILGEKFGTYINKKGYKVLNDKIRIIQGDGVNRASINEILSTMKKYGWSADNLTFGCGGALLQKVDRDSLKFAFKCSSIVVNGVSRDVYKDPITDTGKRSKRGRLKLVRAGGAYSTVAESTQGQDTLRTVYENGHLLIDDSLEVIRERAAL